MWCYKEWGQKVGRGVGCCCCHVLVWFQSWRLLDDLSRFAHSSLKKASMQLSQERIVACMMAKKGGSRSIARTLIIGQSLNHDPCCKALCLALGEQLHRHSQGKHMRGGCMISKVEEHARGMHA